MRQPLQPAPQSETGANLQRAVRSGHRFVAKAVARSESTQSVKALASLLALPDDRRLNRSCRRGG